MSDRIWNAEVASIDTLENKLTIRQKRVELGKIIDVMTSFVVIAATQIKDRSGKPLKLSDIQLGNRVTVDYVKGADGSLNVQSISVSGKKP